MLRELHWALFTSPEDSFYWGWDGSWAAFRCLKEAVKLRFFFDLNLSVYILISGSIWTLLLFGCLIYAYRLSWEVKVWAKFFWPTSILSKCEKYVNGGLMFVILVRGPFLRFHERARQYSLSYVMWVCENGQKMGFHTLRKRSSALQHTLFHCMSSKWISVSFRIDVRRNVSYYSSLYTSACSRTSHASWEEITPLAVFQYVSNSWWMGMQSSRSWLTSGSRRTCSGCTYAISKCLYTGTPLSLTCDRIKMQRDLILVWYRLKWP